MKKTLIALSLLLAALPAGTQMFPDLFGGLFGQPRVQQPAQPQKKAVELDYDLIFNWTFVNDEFDGGRWDLCPSGTLAGARLSPFLGIRIDQGEGGVHRILGGIDLFKEFGAHPTATGFEADPLLENARLIREFSLYYRLDRSFGKTDMRAVFGSFPRALTQGHYSPLIYSDAKVFYDNNFDGLLLSFRRPESLYEIGLDWNGMYGVDRREEFNVFTYGASSLADWFALGWEGMFHHYADSDHAKGVVDDHILHPWARFDFAERTGLQALRLEAGPVAYYCRDRRYPGHEFRFGGLAVTDLRQWNFGLRNYCYYGNDLLPYFADTDASGSVFGTDLYMRMRMFRVDTDPARIPGVFDYLSLYWEPQISEFVSLHLNAAVLFNNGYSGLEQRLFLKFHLDRLGKHARKKAAAKTARRTEPTQRIPL